MALYALGVNSHWRFQRDSALYMGLGRSLAETGAYTFNGEPHRLALPGFPLMLAGIYWTAGESFLAMNVLVSLFGTGCVVLAYLLFRELPLTRRQVLICALLFGLSRTLYYYSLHITTEVPFSFFALAGLYCGTRMARSSGRQVWLWCLGAAAASWIATSIRPFGPAVLAGVLAGVWLSPGQGRRWPANLGRTALLLLPAAVGAGIWAIHCARTGGPMYGQFLLGHGFLDTAGAALRRLPEWPDATTDAVFGTGAGTTAGAALMVLMTVGFCVAVRRGERVVAAFGVVYACGVCLGSPGRRYLAPLLPAMLFWLVLGAGQVGAWAADIRPRFAPRMARFGCVLVCLMLAVNLARIGKVVYESRHPDFYGSAEKGRLKDYFELAEFLEERAAPDDIVLAYEYRLIHYFARVKTRRAKERLRTWGPTRAARSLQEWGVTYVVFDAEKGHIFPDATMIHMQHVGAFADVRRFGELELAQMATPE